MSKPDDWERIAFQSTHLDHGYYSASRRMMRIQFHNGMRYSYSAPPELWSALKSAEHPGQFFRQNVIPNFPGKKTPQ